MDPPVIIQYTARNVDIEWVQPNPTNGVITIYRVFANGTETVTVPGNVTRATISTLKPFTSYQFVVEACTTVGCVTSAESLIITTDQDGRYIYTC